jgi:peptidoglycan hydrolase CwlO-like protein
VKIKRKLFLGFLALFLAVFGVFGWQNRLLIASDSSAEEIQDRLDDLNKKYAEAQAELQAENSKLYRNQTQINATLALLNSIQADIARRESELDNLRAQAELNRTMLAEYIRQLYYTDQDYTVVKLSIFQGDLDDMAVNFDSMLNIKAEIANSLQVISNAKTKNEQAQAELAKQEQDRQEILQTQKVQQAQIAGEVQEKKATVAEIQQKISKLRSTLSSFLGKSYSIEDVVEAVKLASKKTGVRKEFLFAMLDKETDLGRFTGGCAYDKSKMGSTNEGIFKRIADELGYNYKKLKVSCPLSYGIGGAMGVAQFMPTTWGDPDGSPVGWRPKIKSATGHNPPDPWNLTDGVVGMALKLKASGGDSKSGERNAAAAYYCGSRLSRAVCQNYANTVISWSRGYDDYF